MIYPYSWDAAEPSLALSQPSTAAGSSTAVVQIAPGITLPHPLLSATSATKHLARCLIHRVAWPARALTLTIHWESIHTVTIPGQPPQTATTITHGTIWSVDFHSPGRQTETQIQPTQAQWVQVLASRRHSFKTLPGQCWFYRLYIATGPWWTLYASLRVIIHSSCISKNTMPGWSMTFTRKSL